MQRVLTTSISTSTSYGQRRDREWDRDQKLFSFTTQRILRIPQLRPTQGNVQKPPLTPRLMTLEMEVFRLMESKFKYQARKTDDTCSKLQGTEDGKRGPYMKNISNS